MVWKTGGVLSRTWTCGVYRQVHFEKYLSNLSASLAKSQRSDGRRLIEEMIETMDQESLVKGNPVFHAVNNADCCPNFIINVSKSLSAIPSSQVTVE